MLTTMSFFSSSLSRGSTYLLLNQFPGVACVQSFMGGCQPCHGNIKRGIELPEILDGLNYLHMQCSPPDGLPSLLQILLTLTSNTPMLQ